MGAYMSCARVCDTETGDSGVQTRVAGRPPVVVVHVFEHLLQLTLRLAARDASARM